MSNETRAPRENDEVIYGKFITYAINVVPILATIIGGVWVLYEWMDFKRESEQLALRQQKAALSQARYDIAKQGILTRQLELANQGQELQNVQAKFSVDQQEITRKQQALAVEAAKSSLVYQSYQNKLAQHDVSELSADKIGYETKLRIVRLGDYDKNTGLAVFKIWSNINLTNNSKQSIVICYNITDVFVAKQNAMINDQQSGALIPMPPTAPDAIFNGEDHSWKKVAGTAWEFQDGDERCVGGAFMLRNAGYYAPIKGGGGTNVLQSGEESSNGPTFFYKGIEGRLGRRGGDNWIWREIQNVHELRRS